ncbi:MAG TPA: pyridoxamine 5'-phosphate oxidase family protein [Thermoanaerobaculia bacterium]|nr:pyridoxamine 5'-phosphate oxidase family protein [Thermoanaerobaculia bacterium]
MEAIIRAAHLCFAATVTPEGRPNVSPKGTIRVWDARHLFFLDIASPGTRANLAVQPYMEINVVEALSRRGYRFSGPVTMHESGEIFDNAVGMVMSEEGSTYEVVSVVMLELEHAAPLLSPGYWHVADETAMRASWRERRAALDKEFELHIARHGAFRLAGQRR